MTPSFPADADRHPGDVLFRDLTEDQRRKIAAGWAHQPADAADLFDGMTDTRRWEVLCKLEARDGGHEAEVARIKDREDPETSAAWEGVVISEGAALLDELHRALTRYVVLPSPEAADAVVLWTAATHGLPAFEHATRLAVHSPVKRCGKTRLLEIAEATAHHPIPTTNISVPALFRIIDAANPPPTLILDEADRLLGSAKKDDDNRDLVAILNNGFRPGHPTYRCVGPNQVPTPFSNYAMAVIAGIGRLPDTIEDRAINITMRRRLPGEMISKYRLRTDVPALHDLRDRLAEWVGSVIEKLGQPVVGIPDELEDRAEDAWEPLLAVADAAGGHWPARARAAALRLTREAASEDDSLDTRLLADVRLIFNRTEDAFVPSADLLTELRRLDEAPWADLDLTARKLAYRVAKFGVKPKHNTAKTSRGYHLHDLHDAFRRYLPSDPSDPSDTQSDLEKPADTSEHADGSTRPRETKRPAEIPARTAFPDTWTGWTDTPDGSGRSNGHEPPPLTDDDLLRMSAYYDEETP